MTRWVVRAAVLADRPRLRDIYRRASWSNEGDRPALTVHPEALLLPDEPLDEGRSRVAVDGDDDDATVVGFHSTIATFDALEVEDLFVDPDWMRRGAATALIDDVVALAEHAGVRRIDVTGNLHALAFYESIGFVVGGDGEGEVATPFGVGMRMHLAVPLP